MKLKNKDKMIAALQKDCEIRHTYVRGQKTCALGCLALLAGIPRSFFDDTDKERGEKVNKRRIGDERLESVAKAITKKFGLTLDQQMSIQQQNDWTETVAERRDRVVGLIGAYAKRTT